MQTISSEILNESILKIEFNNSPFANAFGRNEANQLYKLLQSIPTDIKGLFWRSNGNVFCSGGNLKDYGQLKSREQGIQVNNEIREALDELNRLPLVTSVLVEGDCFGGGMELLSCFDFIYATPQARFGFWQRKIGLSYGWGGGSRWLKRLLPNQLKQLSLTAETFNAEKAFDLNVVDELVDEVNGESLILTKLMELKDLPSSPVSAIKNFTAENESESFDSIWMNFEHKSILDKFNS